MTATIMESYDAQMLDYQNDLDVQMHVSSSDAWFQDVAPMEDDGHLAFQPKAAITDTAPTIEVDMEAYVEDEHIEYEMVDDHHGHNPTSGELLDVDLLDASAVQSPSVTVTPLPITPSVEYPQPPLITPLPSASDPSVSASDSLSLELTTGSSTINDSTPENARTSTAAQADTSLPVTESSDAVDNVTVPESESVSHNNNRIERAVVSATSPGSETSPEPLDTVRQRSAVEDSAPGVHQAAESNAEHSTVLVDNEDQGDSHHLDSGQVPTEPGTIVNTEMPIPHNGFPEPQTHVDHVSEQVYDGVVQRSHLDNSHTLREDELPTAPTTSSTEASEHAPPHAGDTQSGAQVVGESIDALSNAADEAYLEPPPPILLSIFSTDHPELSLFNKPTEPLPNEDDAQERHILLQQVPTLYYEPLAHAFEFLRQDEYVSTVLELTGNELALEAFELDLAITEDNVYSREVSLHDIHALHVSANLPGPLHLRLYISGPRFIARYHMLQEGLINLNLHVDESQSSNHEETDHSTTESLHEEDADIQGELSGTEGATLDVQGHVEASEDMEGQPEEEEYDHTEEYYEGPPEEVEEATVHTGEIDLSTLPPFVDSPDTDQDEQEHEHDGELTRVAIPIPDNDATGEDHTEETQDAGTAQRLRQDVVDGTGSEHPTPTQDNPLGTEEPTADAHGDAGEGASGSTGSGEGEGSPNALHDDAESEESEGEDHTPAQAHSEEILEPEYAEPTNEERKDKKFRSHQTLNDMLAAPSLEPTHEDHHHEQEEDDLGDHYVDVHPDTHGVEELKDFEDETGAAWDDELDGEGDPDTTWEAEQGNVNGSYSNESSVTLSSKASKRSFDEFGIEHSDDESPISGSPGAKRPRVE
ncbi:hypothetical protein P691DRAFT_756067 [Macrolepiota fuliginosa MF-IS2]|uniref:Proteophosphoglycan ppg4 n=1 Tax=Macrolepiota fuliginosa MF-IS2 TaxID=1400762 RepID=A0A9P5XJZ6_9AGAR|nr:hypothetical protein P691DRAFT_756067 [Macrolepiota fuliginosa MF-IS2]